MKPVDGAHLAFPFRVGVSGRAAQVASLEDHVRDELLQLLLTNPGERVFLPELGGGLRRLVFEGIDDASAAMAKANVSQALSRWLGHRVTVEALVVTTEDVTVTVDLQYRIAGTGDSRQMRFQRSGT